MTKIQRLASFPPVAGFCLSWVSSCGVLSEWGFVADPAIVLVLEEHSESALASTAAAHSQRNDAGPGSNLTSQFF